MARGDRPNIIVAVAHDLGRHLNCYGVRTVSSPNLDRLASEGVRFASAFCTAPQCSPSRASIFTGRYPHCNGVMGLCHAGFAWDLYDGERHLAGLLRDAGYFTALIGNQHETRRPAEMGYDVIPAQAGMSGQVESAATRFLKDHAADQKPFFLQLGFFEPHRAPPHDFGCAPDASKGVTVPPFIVNEMSSREDFGYYQGAIRVMDSAMGGILQALEQNGLKENTLVVFTTDHGMPFPRAKCSVYDPGLETALIMRWPEGKVTGGRVVDGMVSNIDILPTLLEIAGAPVPANVQGRSIRNLLEGADGGREELFAEMTFHDYCDPRRCIRTRTHKLIANFSSAPPFMDPSQAWTRKCITVFPPDPALKYHEPVELYDLVRDPLEHHDLAKVPEHAELVKALLRRLHAWMVETRDPLLSGSIPMSPMQKWALQALETGVAPGAPPRLALPPGGDGVTLR